MKDQDFVDLLEPLNREVGRLTGCRDEHTGKIAGFRRVLQAMNGSDPDGLMRKRLEDRMKKEESTLIEIESAIAQCRGQMLAIEESMKIIGKSSQSNKSLRPNSELARVESIIRRNGKPLSINTILTELGKDDTKDNRNSIRGSLSRYAKDGRIFTKDGDLFGLVEFNQTIEELMMQAGGDPNDP